jgi:hypothetical protein
MASPLSPERVAALVEVVRVNRIVDVSELDTCMLQSVYPL